MKNFFIAFILLLIAIFSFSMSGPKPEVEPVVVGSKPFTEGYILSELIAVMLENNTDIPIKRRMGIQGGTANLHPAMINGDIDIYPEYTGTGWMFVLKKELISDPAEIYARVKQEYETRFDIIWLKSFGFNDTYTLAVKKETADREEIKTYSDLAEISSKLIFGAEYDFFERDDGYDALVETYGFKFKNTKEMDIGVKYQAIDIDQVQVINAFSTDGLLRKFNLVILEDNKNFFPPYQGVTIVRREVLDKHPEIEGLLNKMAGKIDEQIMTGLNYQVDVEKKEAKEVAENFLRTAGLIK